MKAKAINKTGVVLSALCIGLLINMPVNAADKQFYLGGGLGRSNVEPDTSGTIYSISDKNHWGYKFYLGYRMNEAYSIEAYYSDLGEARLSPTGSVAYQDIGLSMMYYFYQPQNPSQDLSAYIRAGLGRMNNQTNLNYVRENDSHLMLGLGVEYPLKENLSLRADLDLYDYDAQLFSIGLSYRFGDKKQSAPQPRLAPQAVEEVVVASPVVEVNPDLDGDGIPNEQDQCPDTAAATKVDSSGCAIQEVIVLKGITFKTSSAEIIAAVGEDMDRLVETLKKYPQIRIEIAGHTDNQGSSKYNQQLSQQRAESVRQQLVERGIAADRMEAKGYGEDKPVADNATAAGRQQNRRVEIHILGQ